MWPWVFDGGDGWLQWLWQQWTIDMAFNGGGSGGVKKQISVTAFGGV